MSKNKLAQTLAVFSKNECRELEKFLASPFFNQRNDVMQLFEWLSANPGNDDREAAWQHIFPEKKYDDQQFRLVLSYLNKLVEEFLALREWQQDEGQRRLALARAYHSRGLEQHFQTALADARFFLEKQPVRNADWLRLQTRLQWEEYRFVSARAPSETRFLKTATELTDHAYLAEKQRHICLQHAQRAVFKSARDAGPPPELPDLSDEKNLTSTPASAVWFYCRKMLEQPGEEAFFRQFKTLLFEHGSIFDAAEILDLYILATNFCIRQVNAGQRQFFREAMDLYKEGMARGYLLENGRLSRFTYHNIVAAGLQVADFEWVEDFIGRYKNALERTWRDSSYSFNRARLEFARGNFDAALGLLQHSNYTDPLLNLAAKTISLKIFFETGEHSLLSSHLDAMQNYIRRKPSLGYHRENYQNIVQFTRKLLTVNVFDKSEIEKLRSTIESAEPLTEREWLLREVGRF